MEKEIFKKGELASSDYFTGNAWIHTLAIQDNLNGYAVGDVVFEKGTRNNWHTHFAGQVLLVTEGAGFYQEKNKPARKLTVGDVVIIPRDVEHWHGASPDSDFTHIAITNTNENGMVIWLDPVTDEEYIDATKGE